ncbi:hypothetical protein SUGI_1027170 [Cryptomeria japonica]|nr:hypothetical protein SUGI_1027170 [Cryptomeria japonica]
MQNGQHMMKEVGFFLKDWEPNFNPIEKKVGNMSIWVYLKILPSEHWNEEFFRGNGNEIGTFVKVDKYLGMGDNNISTRVCVLIDLDDGWLKELEFITTHGVWKPRV